MNYQTVSQTYELRSAAGEVKVSVESSPEVVAVWTVTRGLRAIDRRQGALIEHHRKQLAEACFRLHLTKASQMCESIKGPVLAFCFQENKVTAQADGEHVAEWDPMSGQVLLPGTRHSGFLETCFGLPTAMAEFYCRQRTDLLPEQPRGGDPRFARRARGGI